MPRNHDDDDEPRPRRKRAVADDDQDDNRPSKRIEVRSLSQSRTTPSDEVDDRPKTTSSRKSHDDDDRPKTKSRRPADDEEDDRPKAKSRRPADDDDDDRPKTKSRRQAVDDDDDDDRPRRRSRPDYDEDDEPRPKKKKRPPQKQLNVVGLISMFIGVCCLLLSLFACIGPVAHYLALSGAIIGAIIGIVGLIIAQKSEGRQGMGLPIAGGSINVAAILIALVWMMLINVGEGFEKEFKQEMANAEAREKERKEELAKAGPEVKNAQPGSIIRVSANQFYQAYDGDDERADRLYKNKILEVTGTIQQILLDGDDEYMVLLRGGPDEFETVGCQFFKDAAVRQQLAALRPGIQVTIRGKCLGEFSTIEACILVR